MAIVPRRRGHRALLAWLLLAGGAGSNIALRVAYDARPVYGSVHVRWAEAVDETERHRLEQQYTLTRGVRLEGRTWTYSLADLSGTNIQALVGDTAVEDTDQIDRVAFRALSTGLAPDAPPDPRIPRAYELLSLSTLAAGVAMSIAWAASRLPEGRLWRPSLYTLGLVGVVTAVYAPVTRVMLREGDFPAHIDQAVALTQGVLDFPHFMFHALTAVGVMFRLTPNAAAFIVMLGFQTLAAWGVSRMARRAGAALPVATLLGICSVFVAPILPLALARDAPVYPLGYFLPNALHNPTVTAAKAFVPFLIELVVMLAGATAAIWSTWDVAAIVVLAGLAKPHYVSCLIPVVPLASAWSWLRGRRVPWGLVSSFALATAAVVVWTMTMVAAGTGAVTIEPLRGLQAVSDVERTVAIDLFSIAARACSDLAFPLAVVVLWPGARRFPPLLVAWAACVVSFGQALLLAESGLHAIDGNFLWSPQLGTFGAMAASAAWLGRSSVEQNWRVVVGWSVLLLHVAYGLWWITARVAAG